MRAYGVCIFPCRMEKHVPPPTLTDINVLQTSFNIIILSEKRREFRVDAYRTAVANDAQPFGSRARKSLSLLWGGGRWVKSHSFVAYRSAGRDASPPATVGPAKARGERRAQAPKR
ncbi:hypothetical protein QTP88_012912 [Uroleucon formosanum]